MCWFRRDSFYTLYHRQRIMRESLGLIPPELYRLVTGRRWFQHPSGKPDLVQQKIDEIFDK
jgi:hypothetical protein